MKVLPKPGTYLARRNGSIVVYETDSGALCAAIPVALTNSEVNWSGKHTVTLVKQDGTLMTRTIDNLKKIFGWDGVDPFALEDLPEAEDQSAPEFELADCFHDDSFIPQGETEPVVQFKPQWMNPLGGSSNMPEKVEDRKSLLAKYGSKFKAHSGKVSKPATAPAAKTATKTAAPPAKAASSGPPSRKGSPAVGGHARSSTQEEAWEALQKANPKLGEDELAEKFYAAQDAVRPDANSEMTPAEWGQVLEQLGL